jgi:hypothetical protein
MPQKILNEDWWGYDDRKIRDKRDAKIFECNEVWEVNYLVKATIKAYPEFSEPDIRSAITQCCGKVGSPYPRKEFIACVINRLRGYIIH